MKFKNQRHLILSLKKKSGVELSDAEIKELLGIEGIEEKKPEDKPKEEPKKEEIKAPAVDPAKEEEPKKEEVKAGEEVAAPMSIEELGKAIQLLSQNMNMVMEALASMMEVEATEPAEEAKVDPAAEDPKKEEEVAEEDEVKAPAEGEEEEMDEDEIEKELMKTIAELEGLV